MTSAEHIYGLVICGGQSTRMGSDKSMLDYHGKPQRYFLYKQLQSFCGQVFISCNALQAATLPAAYNFIADAPAYNDIGPIAALLSAFDRFPDKTFIAVACDYPFFSIDEMAKLAAAAQQAITCAAFMQEQGIYEPLLAVYTPAAGVLIKQAYIRQQYSLQRLLNEMQAVRIIPAKEKNIQSIDTPAQQAAAAQETRQIN